MIVLVVPMHSKQEINADSNYVVYTRLIEAIERIRPDWHFFILFPDSRSGYKYEPDGFFDRANVVRIPIRLSPRKMANAITYDGAWWDELFRKIGVNIVWTCLPEIAGHIQMAGQSTYTASGSPLVIAAHNYTVHPTLPYVWRTLELVAAEQVIGSVLADWNVVNSEYCRQMVMDIARLFLNEQAIQRIAEKMSLIFYAPVTDELRLRAPENAEPIIAYNHRLQAYKNFRLTFSTLQDLWDEGLRFRVRYLNNTAEHVVKIARYPFVEIVLTQTRDKYLQALGECDLNVTNSLHETFCISAIESLAMGQPLVAPDGLTFPELVGKEEMGYPFLFRDQKEQKAALRILLSDRALRQEWGRKVSEYVHRTFNSRVWAEEYVNLFERLEGRFNVLSEIKDRSSLVLMLAEWKAVCGVRGRGAELTEITQAMTRVHREGHQTFSNQSMTPCRMLRFLQAMKGKTSIFNGRIYVAPPSDVEWQRVIDAQGEASETKAEGELELEAELEEEESGTAEGREPFVA